jgi:hypothetical protein
MFGVSDGIRDITRSSGRVRRIRFIYRKFRNGSERSRMVPVSSESVLEGSRRLRKFLEGLEGSGILWKVPEYFGRFRKVPTWAAPLPMGLALGARQPKGLAHF